MNKFAVVIAVLLLVGGFALTTVAAQRGAGLVAAGRGDSSPSSRSSVWFPIFVGGGPGSGK